MCTSIVPAKKEIGSPGTRLIDGYEPPHTPGFKPWQEQHLFLMTEPSL